MTPIAIVLILIASLFQAGWNLAGKAMRVSPPVFLAANAAGTLLLLPVVFVSASVVRQIPEDIIPYLLATGLFEMLFYVSLAYAYQDGELSIAFPLVRSLPILLVAGWGLLFRVNSRPSVVALAGYALIVVGSFLLPMRSFRDFQLKSYLNPTMLFVLVAAVGVAGYSMIDSRALDLFRSAVTVGAAPLDGAAHRLLPRAAASSNRALWRTPLVYAFLEGASSTGWLGVYVGAERLMRRRRRAPVLAALGIGPAGPSATGAPPHSVRRLDLAVDLWKAESLIGTESPAARIEFPIARGVVWTARSGQALVLGLGIFLTYTLLLISMGVVRDVSYVVAFNQASIPLGVLFGLLFLGEDLRAPKLLGVAVMTAGLVLTAMG